MAVGAEESGWDGFFSWDGLSLLSMPVDTFDPWAVLAAAAVRTERIALGAMVFALPRRRPWEVVRQALTVDHLSGGRLVLPVGVGVLDDGGFSAVPGQLQSLRERAELLDDAIAYLDRAWSGEKFTFDGTHVHAGEMLFLPRPVERPVVGHHVPMWPVGVWDAERPPLRSLDRTLRADGIVLQLRGERGFDVPTPDDVSALVAWLTTRHAELGLDARRPFDVVVQGELPGRPFRSGGPARRPRRRGRHLVGRVPLEPRDRDPGVAPGRDPRGPGPPLRRRSGPGTATCRHRPRPAPRQRPTSVRPGEPPRSRPSAASSRAASWAATTRASPRTPRSRPRAGGSGRCRPGPP